MKKKEDLKGVFLDIVKNKKVQIAFTIILFLIILITSTQIRLSNLPLLKDQTNGEYILADLDALYFLRLSEVVLETGSLNGIDNMRYIPLNVPYFNEIMPYVIVGMFKLAKLFNAEVSLRLINATSPAYFYAFGLVVFFALCLYLTKSKKISLLASAILAYSPAYLFRTMTGVSDHEAIGMIPFFAAFLVFVIGLNRFDKSWKKTIQYSLLTGFFTSLTLASWGGALNFLLMIFPLSFLLYYLFNIKDEDLKLKEKTISYYALWILSSLFFMFLFNFSPNAMLGRFISSYGIIVPFAFILICLDYLFEKYQSKIKFIKHKFRLLYSLGLTFILGIIGLVLIGKNPIELIKNIYIQLLFPFGVGRVGLTVAENAQPYLTDLMSQVTPIIFWLFFAGMILVGTEIAKNIKSFKHKIYFVLSWILAIVSILFSRISSTSLLNGENFISQALYLVGFGLFVYYFAWLYFNDKFKIDGRLIFLFSWMLIMFISARSAIRTIFAVAPFVAFAAAYFVIKIYDYAKESKDDTIKVVLYFLAIASTVAVISSLFFMNVGYDSSQNGQGVYLFPSSYSIVSQQAKNIGPSANSQWQESMAWVRQNTQERDIFVHWWDYGYFVQYLGQRPTVTDGGHANGYWDHLTARYLLTTPKPETALGFMKAQNVSYLLIDPTDFGKYGAYSKIGGNLEDDRFSAPSVFVSDKNQFRETANGSTRVYAGTTFVDEDINYENTFLPGPVNDKFGRSSYKSYVIGIVLESSINSNNQVTLKQPKTAYFYNGKQYTLPVRFAYINNEIVDFGDGLDAVIMIIPSISQAANGQIQVDNFGSAIYLSPRVQEGLFARLYLMNDPYKQYSTIKEAHFEDDPVVKSLKSQGLEIGDFVYFQGLRAPLKIWKVDYPLNILDKEEFRAVDGDYAELDNLKITSN